MSQGVDYSYFVNNRAARRRPALTRELYGKQFNASKDLISLAEGSPSEQTFPFKKISITLSDDTEFEIKGEELTVALQYIPTQGYPPLVKSIKEFMKKVHGVSDWEKYETLITGGSQDAMSKALEMIVNEGDSILVQEPCYAGTRSILEPFNLNVIGVEQDRFGIIPKKLLETLQSCEEHSKEGEMNMPKVIYINPTASNPCGRTIPTERKREIYKICCDYNIIILEDDAYYFIHFLDEQPTSFLSLDTQGIVLRLDSMSKILSSGLRLGWVTGPKKLLHYIELHISSSTIHSSVLPQVILENLFREWGIDGLLSHCAKVREFYKLRCNYTMSSMEKHLKNICEWETPSGGMFIWFKVLGVPDIYEMILNRGIKKNIILIPGHDYMADNTKTCNYARVSFSRASLEHIDRAIQILAELIKEEKLLIHKKPIIFNDGIITERFD